ncbi:hypothetical protein PIB30_011783 [Stylosanthes scabra]|uniref:Peroxidase n=1 Tax=Stylosanthes scabra TaxID=79078 RepID=A0ABU6R5R2_9FABA|nr:hypothetical protein [Stylosanthes scabra]
MRHSFDPSFYNETCPNVHSIVTQVIVNASQSDPRIFASLLRLHFHDCFVLGCEASVLLTLNGTDSEQQAGPNINSIRGLDVVNQIKTAVENACPGVVSCADILALAAQISTTQSGGPSWNVSLGRRDGLNASQSLANSNLPAFNFDLTKLQSAFAAQGLNTTDLVVLAAQFRDRLYNFNGTGNPDPTLNTTYLGTLELICPNNTNDNNITNLDPTTPDNFDNNYYINLQNQEGLFQSDQVLFSTPNATDTVSVVNGFANDQNSFFQAFVNSMIKMGNIDVITGTQGEIRNQCNVVNNASSSVGIASVISQEQEQKSSHQENLVSSI